MEPIDFTPIRVDQADPGAVVLGTVDNDGTVHTFTPEPGFTRTLATPPEPVDGDWWRLTFDDGYQNEHLGDQLLAVIGQDATGYQYNEHANQLDDWCPWSGKPAGEDDDACPAGCPASAVEEAAEEEGLDASTDVPLLDVGGYLACGCHGEQREHTC